jgi:hypothetical protein
MVCGSVVPILSDWHLHRKTKPYALARGQLAVITGGDRETSSKLGTDLYYVDQSNASFVGDSSVIAPSSVDTFL